MKTTKEILAKYHKQIWTNADMLQGFCAGIGVGITIGLLLVFIYQI
jgi:hypothetical protein